MLRLSSSFLRGATLLRASSMLQTQPFMVQSHHQNQRGISCSPMRKNFFKKMYSKHFDKVAKSELRAAGYLLSTYCTNAVDVKSFFDTLEMPDTYFSWFLVTELHVWMLSVRLMAGETEEGRGVRNFLIEALWKDCTNRSKLVGEIPASERKEALLDMAEQFQASLIIYDNGLLGDDKELAGALWRRFFRRETPSGPHLELLVQYVRRTIQMLDDMSFSDIVIKRKIKWLHLNEMKLQ